MELNIVSFTYLFLRLAPFILVCFFTLASIFNYDFKGLVYLVGLIFSCFITTMVGNVVDEFIPGPIGPPDGICNSISIGGAANFSKLPLGQTVFGFTFAYIMSAIFMNGNIVNNNIPTFVFFPVLILFDMWWNVKYGCNTIWQLIVSAGLGIGGGFAWGGIINATKSDTLKYFSGVNNNEVCSKASKQSFKCTVFKNGKMIKQI